MRYLYLFVVVAFFASCSESPKNQEALTLPDGTLPSLNASNTAPAGLTVNPAHGQPGHDCALPVGAPLKSATASVNPNAQMPVAAPGALNPEHGMPGHDCAIPVGAPLNQSASNTVAPVNNAGVKLNPEHGMPGHDCAIAVGAPLNSKPTTPVQNVSTPAPAPVKSTQAEILQEANGG